MDVQLEPTESPDSDGISATAEVLRVSPRTRVLVLTTFSRPGYLTRAMAAGAAGFLVKDSPMDELLRGVRQVHRGARVIDARLAVLSTAVGPSSLTERESKVLTGAAQGGTSGEIAQRVRLAEGTVRNTLSSAMGKLGAANRADAVRIATERGWLG